MKFLHNAVILALVTISFSARIIQKNAISNIRQQFISALSCKPREVDSMQKRTLILLSTILSANLLTSGCPVKASDFSWTDRNRLAAETWRAVDEGYFDRTFGGQDWFKLRQEVVKKNYNSDEELYKSLASMVSKLGDKYTSNFSFLIALGEYST